MLDAHMARTFQRRIFEDMKGCSPLFEDFIPYFVNALISNKKEVVYIPLRKEYVEEHYELFKKRLESLGYTVLSYDAYVPDKRTIIKVDWSYKW